MEKLSRVLSDFAVEPEKMTRVRGGFLLETGEGLRMLQEYRGGAAKLAAVETLQKSLREQGFFRTDQLLRSKKGELSSRDVDGTIYVLKDWFAGQECSRENRRDLFAGMELLAALHRATERTEFAAEGGRKKETEESGESRQTVMYAPEDLNIIFGKRIRELRRARNFLKSRRRKTDYESELLKHSEYYISCGENALERLSGIGYGKLWKAAIENGTIIHGAYNYHNILILSSEEATSVGMREEMEFDAAATLMRGRQTIARKPRPVAVAVNFERMAVGIQVTDVYDYMRKVLEKNAWNRELGYRLIERYQRERPMAEEEMEILRILFLFPEKYWKLVNHYCNHSKSWLPGKNPEKLAALVRQEEARMKFAEGL